MSSLIAGRYPVGIGSVFFPSPLQHLHQHQHHPRLTAAGTNSVSGGQEAADAESIRGMLPTSGGWPFHWRPSHTLQGLNHHSSSDGNSHRQSPSATYLQRGETIDLGNCVMSDDHRMVTYRFVFVSELVNRLLGSRGYWSGSRTRRGTLQVHVTVRDNG